MELEQYKFNNNINNHSLLYPNKYYQCINNNLNMYNQYNQYNQCINNNLIKLIQFKNQQKDIKLNQLKLEIYLKLDLILF